jgi:hypothetical protein
MPDEISCACSGVSSFVELREVGIDGAIDLLRVFSNANHDEFEEMRPIHLLASPRKRGRRLGVSPKQSVCGAALASFFGRVQNMTVPNERQSAPATELRAFPWIAFRHKAFTVVWIATVVANVGTWMYNAASGWLMTSLDGDPLTVPWFR